MTRSLTLDHTPNSLLAKETCAPLKNAMRFLTGEKEKKTPKFHYVWTTLLVTLWYAFAIIGTIASKSFMKQLPKPITLAGGQMFIGALLDLVLLFALGLDRQIDRKVFYSALPVGFTLTFGRALTYFSYKTVAASLTQTVKASSPVFTVILLLVTDQKCQPYLTLCSLIPIVLGVVLSAVTEIEMEFHGLIAAVVATLTSTIQSLYAKRAIRNHNFHPVVFHMCSCLWACMLLAPCSLLLEGQPGEVIISMREIGKATGGAINHIVFFSFVCYWGQNLCSTLVLSQMHVLSHQVANVSRRFALILCTMMYFGNVVTVPKIVGILMALSGFFWFSFTKKRDPKALVNGSNGLKSPGKIGDIEMVLSNSHARSRSKSPSSV
ncbi:hypothetical protein AAMO2058_000558300 [Amorphochlora amoebiformis]